MKTITLLAAMLGTALVSVTSVSAQSSAQQARFEAFVEARLIRGELPLSALTRQQQADFGAVAVAELDTRALAVTDLLFAELTTDQFARFFETSFNENFLSVNFDTLQGQALDLVFNDARSPSRELTTVRQLRRSGLIIRGARRFERPEFTPSNTFQAQYNELQLSVYRIIGTGFPLSFAGTFGDFLAPVFLDTNDGDLFPDDVDETAEIIARVFRRVVRTGGELSELNPNFVSEITSF